MKPSIVFGPRPYFRSLWIVTLFCAVGLTVSCLVVLSMNRTEVSAFNNTAIEHAASDADAGEKKLPFVSILPAAQVR